MLTISARIHLTLGSCLGMKKRSSTMWLVFNKSTFSSNLRIKATYFNLTKTKIQNAIDQYLLEINASIN